MHNPSNACGILKKKFLQPQHMADTACAKQAGVYLRVLSDVVNKNVGISATPAIGLWRAPDEKAQFWLTLQLNFDLFRAQAEPLESSKANKEVWWSQIRNTAA